MQEFEQAGVKATNLTAERRALDVEAVEGRSTVTRFWGAVVIWTVGLLTVNILPLIFQALQGRDGIGEGELGTLGASFVLGTVMVTGTSPLWIQHANWRLITISGLVVSAGGFVLSVWASGFHELLICFTAVGAGAGLIQTPSYAVLGSARDTVRAFAIALFVSMVLPAILSFSVSDVSANSGGTHFLWIVAAIFGAAIPLAGALPKGPTRSAAGMGAMGQSPASVTAPSMRLRDYGAATAAPIAASVAGGIFSGVIMAVYSFVGSIAGANGMPADLTGHLVGFGLLGALAGSLVPTILESWMRPTAGLALIVTLLVTAAYPAMLSSSSNVLSAGFVMACLFGTAGFAYFLAMVRTVDPTHRIYISYAAFQSTGIAAATYLAGVLLQYFSPVVMLTAAGGCLIASWLIWLLALQLSVRFPARIAET